MILTQRRGKHSDINTVIKFIQDELKGSSLCFGYRYMLQKLHSSAEADLGLLQHPRWSAL